MNKKWLIILPAIFLLDCRKENSGPQLSVANGVPVTVTLDRNQPGMPIPATFEGLSYETGILDVNPGFLNINNTVLVHLLKNLGPGILRVGGNSSDEITWTGSARSANTPQNSLTTSDIDRLSAFAGVTGWPVLFGLNLGSNDMAAASNEAQYVYNSLGENLYALQAGNEPDIYRSYGQRPLAYNYNNYQGEWETYFSAVRSMAPQAPFAGPDISYNTDWMTSFAGKESNQMRLLDGHYYNSGPASKPSITYQTILALNGTLSVYLQTLENVSAKYHLPYRITECNSVYGGGKTGVSDVFASALWALDFMWEVAENNGQGINFHGGSNLIYSPVAIDNGVLTARPEYYAMLAFKYGSEGGTIIPANTDQPEFNYSVYACSRTDNTLSVTLINKDDAKSLSFTILPGKKASLIQIARLTAPAITSATGTTFAGSMVNTDGTFKLAVIEQFNLNQNSFIVNVPAGSAAVVTVR